MPGGTATARTAIPRGATRKNTLRRAGGAVNTRSIAGVVGCGNRNGDDGRVDGRGQGGLRDLPS